jgi:hypothetical protein
MASSTALGCRRGTVAPFDCVLPSVTEFSVNGSMQEPVIGFSQNTNLSMAEIIVRLGAFNP